MKIINTLLFNLVLGHLSAQYTFFNPKEAFAIEVSLENSSLKRLPIYRNSISSLLVLGDYIIGGTAANDGLSPFVFTASMSKREMISTYDIGTLMKGQKAIRSGFCKLKNNVVYAGTIADSASGEGGHLMEVSVGSDGSIKINDLGIPVPGEGIFSLAGDAKGRTLYGISYPTGIFFSYDIKNRSARLFRDIAPSKKDLDTLNEYVLTPEDYLCKALIEDNHGLIYGSTPVNRIFCFDPAKKSFTILNDNLPEVWGRRSLGQIESWAKAKNGNLYGGNAGDGQLFEINPETKNVKNLGKPVSMNHIRGLVFGRDGKLYGIAGALPGYAHLFSYDPLKGYTDFGNPQFTMKAPGIEQGIDWRGFQLGTIASSADGKYIVMGEDETLSQLLIFAVESK